MCNLLIGETDYMRLICQVYSPTETQDRALYIFCCVSNQKCSLQSTGWLVFRNQVSFNTNATNSSIADSSVINSNINNLVSKSKIPMKPHDSVWGFLANETSTGRCMGNEIDSVVDLTELEAMVEVADQTATPAPLHKHQSKAIAVGKADKSKKNSQVGSNMNTTLCASYWTAYKISDEFDEDVISSSIETAVSSSSFALGVASDERVLTMYQTYLKDEDDCDLVSKLPAMLESGLCHRSHVSTSSHERKKFIEGSDDVSDCDQGAPEDEDAKFHDSITYSTEMLFQHKCSLRPHQVLRYIYNGVPMWCTAPAPIDSLSVPRCEICGNQRVFEMQLMPALLSLSLHVPSREGSVSQSQTAIDCGTDFDFGVVAVWSCPESCCRNGDQDGCHLYSEVAVVQPPSDVVHMHSTPMLPETNSFESDA